MELVDVCRIIAFTMALGETKAVALICENDKQLRLVNDCLINTWKEIPIWMKPRLTKHTLSELKFVDGSFVHLVLNKDHLIGGTYEGVFASTGERWHTFV